MQYHRNNVLQNSCLPQRSINLGKGKIQNFDRFPQKFVYMKTFTHLKATVHHCTSFCESDMLVPQVSPPAPTVCSLLEPTPTVHDQDSWRPPESPQTRAYRIPCRSPMLSGRLSRNFIYKKRLSHEIEMGYW